MRANSRGRLVLSIGTSFAALLAIGSILWFKTSTVPRDQAASPSPVLKQSASPRPGELFQGSPYTGEENTSTAGIANNNAERNAAVTQYAAPAAPEVSAPPAAVPEQRLGVTRPLRQPPSPASTALTASPTVMPTRIFSGPTQYPPATFAAYGIVAFTSLAAPAERERYEMICQAYVTTLLHYSQVVAPHEQQMVTVWPIDSDDEATHLNLSTQNNASPCKEAIDHYGLHVAKMAIEDAKNDHVPVPGRGPFLLAWSPAKNKGQIGALVLRLDLSQVTTLEQAKERFNEWSTEIAENPELWETGWNIEKLRTTIRFWADHYGPGLLQVFGGKG